MESSFSFHGCRVIDMLGRRIRKARERGREEKREEKREGEREALDRKERMTRGRKKKVNTTFNLTVCAPSTVVARTE